MLELLVLFVSPARHQDVAPRGHVFIFLATLLAYVILVPWLGIELVPSVEEAWNLNHWTIRKFLLAFLIGQVYW